MSDDEFDCPCCGALNVGLTKAVLAHKEMVAGLTARCEAQAREIALFRALLAADQEMDLAQREWDAAREQDPTTISDANWKRTADRFERATMRRIGAMHELTPIAGTAEGEVDCVRCGIRHSGGC